MPDYSTDLSFSRTQELNIRNTATTGTFFLTFADSNNSSATSENVYTTSSFTINPGIGHLNIGGTPRSTWDPDRSRGLHISTRQAVGYRQHAGSLYTVLETDELFVSRNVVFTTSGHQYANSNAWATLYQQASSGFHAWFNSNENISGPGVALAANQMMTLTSNGNLGVGNTNPTARLEVTGDVRITSTATFLGSVVPATNTVDSVGYTGMPQNLQSTSYTLVASDAGKTVVHPITDNTARTFTIPANSSVAYPAGTAITFVNMINTLTIAITTDTMYLAGSGTTGTRTLAAFGMASAVKITTNTWVISGNGLS